MPDDTDGPRRRGATAARPSADPAPGGATTEVEDAPDLAAPTGTDPLDGGTPDRGAADETAADHARDDAAGDADAEDADEDSDDPAADDARGLSLPLVPVLAVLLALLVAGTVFLWVTRPGESSVRTGDYVGALQAARAGIVDVTSFDHVTLDDDIEQIRNVTTGDLREETVQQLDASRQQITDAQAVVNTTVVGAAVGAVDGDSATVFAVLQSTQQTSASEQAQVQRYRVEIDLTREDGRWLLSGITGR